MTPARIQRSILKNELDLTFFEKMTHFGILFLYFFFSITLLFVSIVKSELQLSFSFLAIGCIFIFLIIYSYRKLKLKLKFTVIKSEQPKNNIIKAIQSVSNDLGWEIITLQSNLLIATSPFSFSHNTWGERITIIFKNQEIFINSINDPSKSSSITKGRNDQNVAAIVLAIQSIK